MPDIGFMEHSYQEIDAAVTQVGVNTAAIATKASTSDLTAEQAARSFRCYCRWRRYIL